MSAQREIYTGSKLSQSVVPAAYDSDQDGAGVDTVGFGSALVIADIGAEGITLDGSNYILIEVEESDDNVTFTDVANADLTNYVTGLNPGTIAKLDAIAEAPSIHTAGYKGNKRYIRGVVNFVGTHGAATPLGVSILQQHPSTSPVNATGNLT